MTYLTERGVKEWLRSGRLSGRKNERDEWRVHAENLTASHLQHLIRK
jgi:hypothetical protein